MKVFAVFNLARVYTGGGIHKHATNPCHMQLFSHLEAAYKAAVSKVNRDKRFNLLSELKWQTNYLDSNVVAIVGTGYSCLSADYEPGTVVIMEMEVEDLH